MELLQTAVDDVGVLIATGRALSEQPPDTDLGADEGRLRMQLRRAAGAYLDLLARRKHGVFDSEALAACRVAAEQQMPLALRAAPGLAAIDARGKFTSAAAASHAARLRVRAWV